MIDDHAHKPRQLMPYSSNDLGLLWSRVHLSITLPKIIRSNHFVDLPRGTIVFPRSLKPVTRAQFESEVPKGIDIGERVYSGSAPFVLFVRQGVIGTDQVLLP